MEKLTLEKLYEVLSDPKVIAYSSQAYEKVYLTNAENHEAITKTLKVIQEYQNTSKSVNTATNIPVEENRRKF